MSDQAQGKAKEIVGKVTGDDELESEGRAQQAKGKVEDAAEQTKDAMKGTAAAAKDDDEEEDDEEGAEDGS